MQKRDGRVKIRSRRKTTLLHSWKNEKTNKSSKHNYWIGKLRCSGRVGCSCSTFGTCAIVVLRELPANHGQGTVILYQIFMLLIELIWLFNCLVDLCIILLAISVFSVWFKHLLSWLSYLLRNHNCMMTNSKTRKKIFLYLNNGIYFAVGMCIVWCKKLLFLNYSWWSVQFLKKI